MSPSTASDHHEHHGRKRQRNQAVQQSSSASSSASELEFSTAERREMNPNLQSLLLPWVCLAVVAIGVALLQSVYSSSDSNLDLDNHDDDMDMEDLMEDIYSSSNISRRLNHHHHPSLFPLTTSDKWGIFLATLGLMVAAGGGIGGGGILVPIYCLVLGFSPKHAIPLSNVTIFGGAIANTVLNVTKRHPLADRPLVDWDLILVMEPLTIGGALMGAFLNKLLPEAVLTVMLVVLLTFTAYTSLKKAIKMYKIETIHLRELGLREDGTKESELTKLAHGQDDSQDADASHSLLEDAEYQESDDNDNNNTKDDTTNNDKKKTSDGVVGDGGSGGDYDEDEMASVELNLLETEASKKKQLEEILEYERTVPMHNIYIMAAVFVVVLTINLVKGGGAFPSPLGIVCGSFSFWMANGIMLGWIIVVSLFVRAYLVNQYRIKLRVGFPYVEGDIKWDPHATIVYPCICCLAGFFAGMFGVGGGIVKGPLMLAMGVHPAVSAATSATMILFTSFTATTSFIVFGLLINDYALAVFILGFFATLVGQEGLSYLMKKSQRNSYIAFSIGGVVLLSAILMTIQSLLRMAEGANEKSGGVCG